MALVITKRETALPGAPVVEGLEHCPMLSEECHQLYQLSRYLRPRPQLYNFYILDFFLGGGAGGIEEAEEGAVGRGLFLSSCVSGGIRN